MPFTIATPWPVSLPIIGEPAQRFADGLAALMETHIEIVSAADLGIPPGEGMRAVADGRIDAFYGTPFFWVDALPEAYAFFALPNGANDVELATWVIAGGGARRWEALYAPHGVRPFLVGTMGPTPLGWFHEPIRTVDDLRGLRFRGSGVGVAAMARLGAVLVEMPQNAVLEAMHGGDLDGFEMVGPAFDIAKGAHMFASAPVYYPNGFHHPSAGLELIVSERTFAKLGTRQQNAIQLVARSTWAESFARMRLANAEAFRRMGSELGVRVLELPDPVNAALREAGRAEAAARCPGAAVGIGDHLDLTGPYAASFEAAYILSREKGRGTAAVND